MRGIRRTLGTHQRGKSAMTLVLLRKVLASLEQNLRGLRDRAILLVGFAGGMRRSELASIRAENLWRHDRGITVFLPCSKTDQEGAGREVELLRGRQPIRTPSGRLTCPVRTLDLWLAAAKIKSGPVFRNVTAAQTVRGGLSGHSLGSIIKRAFMRAGFTADELERFSAHSLRAGFATEAYRNGANEWDIMRQTGHATVDMVRRYIRVEQEQRLAAARKLRL
jgi:integrase